MDTVERNRVALGADSIYGGMHARASIPVADSSFAKKGNLLYRGRR